MAPEIANFKGNENLADSEVFKKTDMFKKLKDASKSIWDNRVEKSYRGKDYKYQLHEPINDLNLVIDLGELK